MVDRTLKQTGFAIKFSLNPGNNPVYDKELPHDRTSQLFQA
jgi:hypothetical protein